VSSDARLRAFARSRHAWFVGASILVCVAAYPDVVFGGRTFLPIGRVTAAYDEPPFSAGYRGRAAPLAEIDPGASAWQTHPWAYAERRALAAGTLPLWDRFSGLGHPLLANGQTQTFNPLHWLVLIDPDRGGLWDFHFLLLRFLAALFSCYLLGELGVRRELSVLGAAFGGINPAFTVYLTRGDLEAYAVFPALLFCLFRLRRTPGFAAASALAGAIAITVVAGHPEPSFSCLLAACAIAAVIALRAGSRARFVGWAAFAADVAVLVSAPYWLPLLNLIRSSYNVHPVGTGSAHRPPVLALQWLFPAIASRTSPFRIFDDPPALGFLAPAMAALACVALLAMAVSPSLRVRLAWVAGPIVLALKIYGAPGTGWLGKLPLIERMPTEVYFQFPALYALGIAGVVGTSTLLEEAPRRRTAVLAGTAVLLLLLTLLAPRLFPSASLSRHWPLQAAVASMVIVATTALVWLAARPRGAKVAWIGLLAVVAGDLALYRQRLSSRGNLTAAGPYVEWLQARAAEGPLFHVMGFGGRLMPNMATAFGLEDLRITDALAPAEYMTFVRRFLQRDLLWDWFLTADMAHAFRSQSPILDWLNVRYVVAGPELSAAGDGLQEELSRTGHRGWDMKTYSIDGESLPVLFQHPNDEGAARVGIPREYPVLAFALAQDPRVWSAAGDGATYEVAVIAPAGSGTIFSRMIDPKNHAEDRHWIRDRVDLSRWAGEELTLVLRARSDDTRADWGGWGDLHWESRSGQRQPPERATPRYELAFRDPEHPTTAVFENRQAWPRVFASDRPIVERSAEAVLDRIESLLGTPGPHVVVAGDFPLARWVSMSGPRQATGALRFAVSDVHRGVNDMIFAVEVERPSLVVVTEMLARGWHATVDGAPEALFRANFLFRGLLVGEGKHRVRLWYWPAEWTSALALFAAGCLVWGGAWAATRLRRAI
jgi:hypothetical protein